MTIGGKEQFEPENILKDELRIKVKSVKKIFEVEVENEIENKTEWGFTESPNKVDLQKIWDELTAIPSIYAYSYLENFYNNAPLTYAKFREWRLNQNCKIFNWDYDPQNRYTFPKHIEPLTHICDGCTELITGINEKPFCAVDTCIKEFYKSDYLIYQDNEIDEMRRRKK